MNKLKIAILTLALTVGGVASAELLTNYVSHTGDATIAQSVTWGNGDTGDRTYGLSGVGGSTYTLASDGINMTNGITGTNWNIENNANNNVDVVIVTTVIDDDRNVNITSVCGITHTVGTASGIHNGDSHTLLTGMGDLPFNTTMTLPAYYSGNFTITTSVNPVTP